MASQYLHLTIEKSPKAKPRRRPRPNVPQVTRENPTAHGKGIARQLVGARAEARKQPGAEGGTCLIKLEFLTKIDPRLVEKHGLQFVSHENGKLCLAFADEKGLAEFADHLARLGLEGYNAVKYKQLLLALEQVGSWTPEDRKSWALKKNGLPLENEFVLDVECFPIGLAGSSARLEALEQFEAGVKAGQVAIVDRVSQDSLVLYRLRCNASQAEWLLNHRDVRQVDLPPASGLNYHQRNIEIPPPEQIGSPQHDAPRVCVLDSGINASHPLLKKSVGEAVSFVADSDAADDCGHGTGVAGIALYGDLEACASGNSWQPACWLLSGKVMSADPKTGQAKFDEKTIESQLEEAIAYFADSQGCRIFNLSLGNANAPYDGRHIQGIACTLDRLARERDLLIVVSVGNFSGTDDVPETSWRDEYPSYLLAEESCLIDPAPALNVLTVGSLARHDATNQEQRYGEQEIAQLSPAGTDQLSPFTRHGASVGKAIKPELVAHGGNGSIEIRRENSHWKLHSGGLGVMTCNHDFIAGTLLCDMVGTSFAAPYITHLAARLLGDYPDASANFLRAMLVNHSRRPMDAYEPFADGQRQKLEDELLGYGKPDDSYLYRSGEEHVVMIAEEAIREDECQFFALPLPDEFLRSNRATREIRITLAHTPPVRTTRIEYKASRIRFQLVNGESLEDVQRHFDHSQIKEESSRAETSRGRDISSDRRNPGTVQSSVWARKQLNTDKKWFIVVTRNDYPWGNVLCNELENYALVVSVSDRENAEPRLYTQIKQRLQQRAAARTQS